MKNHARRVLICGAVVVAGALSSAAAAATSTPRAAGTTAPVDGSTHTVIGLPPTPSPSPSASPNPVPLPSPSPGSQWDALIKMDLSQCDSPVPVVPPASVRSFSPERVSRTLTGIWRGRVWGDYPPELMAADGYLNVDYYWIVDAQQGESLILEQLSSVRSAPPAAGNARAFSFMSCAQEGYVPQHPKQVHEFQKISDSLAGARQIIETSTGLVVDDPELSLSAVWQRLVETRYFDTARFGAYAGALFKPFEVRGTTNAAGIPMVSVSYHAEYRGSGQTATRFETGVPVYGQESGSFIGVSTSSGDYLVSSIANGLAWLKAELDGVLINMLMDKVVIGPLLP